MRQLHISQIYIIIQNKLEITCSQHKRCKDSKMGLKYYPKEKRSLGRHLKQWKNSVI